jgi:hypothetical protein
MKLKKSPANNGLIKKKMNKYKTKLVCVFVCVLFSKLVLRILILFLHDEQQKRRETEEIVAKPSFILDLFQTI